MTRSHESFTKLSTKMNRVIATAAPSENNSCAEPRLSAVLGRLIDRQPSDSRGSRDNLALVSMEGEYETGAVNVGFIVAQNRLQAAAYQHHLNFWYTANSAFNQPKQHN
jgi:hypothetical protein